MSGISPACRRLTDGLIVLATGVRIRYALTNDRRTTEDKINDPQVFMAVTCRDRLNKCLFLASARPRLVSFRFTRNRKVRRFPRGILRAASTARGAVRRPIAPPGARPFAIDRIFSPCSARSLHHPPRAAYVPRMLPANSRATNTARIAG